MRARGASAGCATARGACSLPPHWDRPARFFDKSWVIATRHNPGLNQAMELNNRTFVGFKLMMNMMKAMKDTSQPNDEVTFFHRASGMVIGGHNCQFMYTPKDYVPPPGETPKMGGFPMSLLGALARRRVGPGQLPCVSHTSRTTGHTTTLGPPVQAAGACRPNA